MFFSKFTVTFQRLCSYNHLRTRFLIKRHLSNTNTPKGIKKLKVKEILNDKPSDQQYFVYGWVKYMRKSPKLIFIHIDDGSTCKRLQVIIDTKLIEKVKPDLHYGCSVSCMGRIVSSIGPQQPTEMICEDIEVIGKCDPKSFPLKQRKDYKRDYLRKRLHLRAKLKLFAAIVRIRSEMINSIHIYMKQNDFINVTTPVITSNDCEGGGQVFRIYSPYCNESKSYFQKATYLTVSGQFHLEAMACALSRVYTLNSAFRAEPSESQKHLCEFLMLEVEECFIETLNDLMDRVESICKFITYYITLHCADDLKIVMEETKYEHLDKIANKTYIRITFAEAMEILQKSGEFPDLMIDHQFNNAQEKFLVNYFENNPVFITHFPSNIKPFYMKQSNGKALCFDLLSPICGEVCGGSIREDNYDELNERIAALNSFDNLKWYLELRKFGCPLHGGFGIGFDRLLQSITGMINIKDVTSFPRWPYNCLL